MRTFTLAYIFIATIANSNAQYADTLYWQFTRLSGSTLPVALRGGDVQIEQTPDGYMWFGTALGLYRYDGYEFRQYKPIRDDSTSLGGLQLYCLKCDKEGNLWIGGDGWLSRMDYNTGKFRTWRHEKECTNCVPEGWMKIILPDVHNENLIWLPVVSRENLCCRFDLQKNDFTLVPMPEENDEIRGASDVTLKMVQDSTGLITVSKISAIIQYNPAKGLGHQYNLPVANIHSYPFIYNADSTFTNIENRLFLLNSNNDELKLLPTQLPNQSNERSFYFQFWYSPNEAFFITDKYNHPVLVDFHSHSYRPISWNLGNEGANMQSFKDRDGRIWLATPNGIYFMDELARPFRPMKISSWFDAGYRELHINRVVADEAGEHIFCCTGHDAGLFVHHIASQNTIEIKVPKDNKGGHHIDDICTDISGNTYASNNTQFFRLDKSTASLKEIPLLISDSLVGKYLRLTYLFPDSKGNIWIGTWWNGVLRYNPADNSTHNYPYPSVFPYTDLPLAAFEDDEGKIYFYSHHGICFYEPTTDKFIPLQVKNESGNLVNVEGNFRGMAVANDGGFWLASGTSGLYHYFPKNQTWTNYNSMDGLQGDIFNESFVDSEGVLWSRTVTGMAGFDERTKKVWSFTVQDMGAGNQENFELYFNRKSQEIIAHTGLHTLYSAKVSDLKKNQPEYPLLLTGFKVLEKDFPLPGPLSSLNEVILNYRQNIITLEYALLSYSYSDRTTYSYRLDGLSDSWVDAGTTRVVSFSNLDPGHYTFWLRAKTMDGLWRERPPLQITIEPAYWQTWWFRILSVLIIAGILIGAVRYYFRRKLEVQRLQLEKQQQLLRERTRIASELHDDLGSGLTKISLMSQVANKMGGEKRESTLKKISESSSEMVDSMNEIIWALNTKNDSLENLIGHIRKMAFDMYESSDIKLEFISPESLPDVSITGEIRRNIFLIVKEALHNALKYSNASHVRLNIELEEQTFRMIIVDNGNGFSDNALQGSGYGLVNMRKRAEEIGGKTQH